MFTMVSMFILVLVAVILISAQNDPNFDSNDVNNISQVLDWNNHALMHKLSNYTNGNYYHDIIIEGIFKSVDVMGWCVFEIGKMAMKAAIENPNIMNGNVLMILIILCLIAPLIYPAFIILVSLILITKEWITTRREKRTLNQLNVLGNKTKKE